MFTQVGRKPVHLPWARRQLSIGPANFKRERAGLCIGILFGQIGGRGKEFKRGAGWQTAITLHVGAQMRKSGTPQV